MAGWLLYSPHIISNYAIHCSAYTINNGRTNVRQWLRQAYSPSPRCDAFFPNASLPLFPPLKRAKRRGDVIPPPLKGGEGGMSLCVRSFVIQSEANPPLKG
ncbi:hypothetical protein TFKS16_1884 [Tannerella forsythia KS16]|nr:hypothetical protein TFKS16_1884 [Tannerella forsythia KS16]